ncbi:MAG: NAD(P)-binding domain-containing protein [Micromonosporaceae bacterium]
MKTFHTEVLIIGAGPGGLQLAERLQRAKVPALVVDAADRPGSFFRRYPRHRRLISVNKPNVDERFDNPMRFDWNSLLCDDPEFRFTRYSSEYFPDADDMVWYLADFARRCGLTVRYGTRVLAVEEAPDGYTVTIEDGPPLTARRVVVASGMAPYLPAIPGIEHAERYADFRTDPDGFQGARVLIIGKGNSGFEIAASLTPTAATIHLVSPSPVRLAWNTHYVGHLRAVNNEALDGYQLKIGAAALDAEVVEIRRDGGGFQVDLAYTHAAGHRVTYRYDRVIAATGFRFDPTPLAPLRPQLCRGGRFPEMTADYRCPTSPGLYYAGNVTHARDYRKTSSGFIHGFRYNASFLAKVLAYGQPPADAKVAPDPATLAETVLRRLNHSDALYLQPGYLADVYVANGVLAHHAAVPLDWVREGGAGQGWRAAVTLEYGPPAPDPLRVDRSSDPSYATATPFLHPVVRILRGDHVIDRLDLLEDLENRYSADEWLPPLQSFFQTALDHTQP